MTGTQATKSDFADAAVNGGENYEQNRLTGLS
jgi:hypothetical protein